jgi:hypothetical protein
LEQLVVVQLLPPLALDDEHEPTAVGGVVTVLHTVAT